MYRSYNLILVSYIFIKVCIDLVLTTQAGGGRANKIPSSEIAASTNNVNITKYINKYNIYIYTIKTYLIIFFSCALKMLIWLKIGSMSGPYQSSVQFC